MTKDTKRELRKKRSSTRISLKEVLDWIWDNTSIKDPLKKAQYCLFEIEEVRSMLHYD